MTPLRGKWLCAYRMIASPDLFTGTCHMIRFLPSRRHGF